MVPEVPVPKISFGGVQIGAKEQAASGAVEPGMPMRIAILGDFSGRANRGLEAGPAKLIQVDRDNLEEVLAKLDVRLERTIVAPGGEPVSIRFREIDDFHPDRLVPQVELFESLRGTRRRLLNAATFDAAAAEVRGWSGAPAAAKPAPASPSDGGQGENVFELLMNETEKRSADERASGLADIHALIRDIAAPYSVPGRPPQQTELVACVDQALAATLRALLHHPDFQALEAAWRGLDWLVRQLETDNSLQLHIWDISRDELARDLASPELEKSTLYRTLVEKGIGTPGGARWGLLAGLYRFGAGEEDVQLLGRLAKIAASAGAPWVSAASGEVVGCPRPDETPEVDDWSEPAEGAWKLLRELPEAAYAGLAWPRYLARAPYGAKTSPIEAFEFEELAEGRPHVDHLWGNPALLVAWSLGASFVQSGWDLRPGEVNELSGLASYVIADEDGSRLRPCGETVLRERGVERVRAQGLIPVLSSEHEDRVWLGAIQSLAGSELRGGW